MEAYDCIILGGGPAGMTAAIYTSRSFIKTLVIAGNPSGGQLLQTSDVENFPGFFQGISGPELISNMRNQAEKFEAEFVDSNAIDISGSKEENFKVKTDSGKEYEGRSIIIATGASARWLGLESEQKLRGKGVSACATCDGYFFRDKTVAVVGGGDSAMEESTFLTKFADKVYVLVRKSKDGLRASKIMQKKAFDKEKIQFMFNTEVLEILGENKVSGLKVVNNQTKEENTLEDVEGLFLAIGHIPNTDFLRNFIELDHKGYIKVTEETKTTKPGVFAAGDVIDFKYRQAVTAAGMGCEAAIDVSRFLEEHA